MNLKMMIAILSLLLFGVIASAAEKSVTVFTLYGYPPHCFLKNNAERALSEKLPVGQDSKIFQGYSWDVFRESFHAMGYTINLKVYPWARTMLNLKQGKGDLLFPAGKNQERMKTFYYSKESVNLANFLVYVRKDSPIQWKNLDSLKGLSIGTMRKFNFGDEWEQNKSIKKYSVNTILQGFKMLNLKRLDGVVGYEINWDYTLKQAGWNNRFKKLPVFDFSAEYVIGLKNKRVLKLLKDYDRGKRRIMKNGTFQKITKKWQ